MVKNGFRAIASMLVVLVFLLSSGPLSGASPPVSIGAPFVEGEVLVGTKPGVSLPAVARAIDAQVGRSVGDGTIHVLVLQQGSVEEAVQTLRTVRGVAFAEPNWLRQLHQGPNDDGYWLKWDLDNTGDTGLCDGSDCPTVDADMDWQEAYDLLGAGFAGPATVAVIDTGIDAGHPDLNDKIVSGYDYLDGDTDPADSYGHGTHVAGIALAETNNGAASNDMDTAGVGYSPNIQVMPLRVCDANGCPTSAIVDAIYHAADNGANVINLSLGGRFGSAAEEQAINYAWSKGLIIAASSGNDGAGRVSYPAAFVNAIAVGSTNWHDQVAGYSNKGGDLDVVAPGGEMSSYHDPGGIYSTMPTYDVYLTTSYGYSTDYDQLQGTSMAAPQVSGLAGLLFAVGVADANGNGRTNDEIRAIIENTADDLGRSGWDRDYGWGRINVYRAVQAAVGESADHPPTVTITNPTDGDTLSGTVTVTADATDDNGVTQVEFLVGGGSIGVDADGSDGWSASWATTEYGGGSHTVSATATDTAGQTAVDSVTVSVSNGGGDAITLTATGYKVRGLQKVDLAWSGATSTQVDVLRDGQLIATIGNDGSYTDNVDQRGSGSYTYQVCEAGTSICSNQVTVTF
jgi:thermitase